MAFNCEKTGKVIVEEIEVTAGELAQKIKELIEEGNAAKLIVKKPDGEKVLEIPLTAGVMIGGALTIISPLLMALTSTAALLASYKVEIVRS